MEHFYQQVPGWFNYESLYSTIVNWAPEKAHFVECGVWKGKSAAYMCVEIINSGKTITFDCIDTFKGSLDEDVHQQDPDVINDRLMEVCIENLKPVEGHYNLFKISSVEAAKNYEDESLHFVNIDGAHDYDSVKADIEAWLPKVKKGCYLAGDDFHHEPLRRAVYDCFPPDKVGTIGNSWIYQVE
jgi:cephalosporin hydroxylase